MGTEILKNRFLHNFLNNSTSCQEYFSKFQANRSKILGERDFRNSSHSVRFSLSLIPMHRLLYETRFSQNCIFEVGGQDFPKTNAPILLKFCTLVLNKIDSCLYERFFSLIATYFTSQYMA